MKFDRKTLLLYAVTDRAWLAGRALAGQVEEALLGGATFVQLREKELPWDASLAEAFRIREVTSRFHVPFVINDNIELALASGADGAHVGRRDRAVSEARALLGAGRILGASVQTAEQAIRAERDGADYLGVGAVFPTSSKPDADSVSLQTLRDICACVSIPVVAIGGITEHNVMRLAGSGIAGIAVISALFSGPDAAKAARSLRRRCGEAAFG